MKNARQKVVLQRTVAGNDPNDNRDDPDYLARAKLIEIPAGPDASTSGKEITPTPYAWRPAETIPPREWLHGKHYIRKFLVLTGGTYGIAKSTLTVIDALSMATGRCLLTGNPLRRPLRVWLYNTEDPREEVERKVAAVMKHYQITGDDVGDRLSIDTSRENKLVVGGHADGPSSAAMPSSVDGLIAGIRRRGVDVLIVDPLVHSHAADENNNTQMGEVMSEWRRVAEEGDCCVELVHHTRKSGNGEASVDDVRGAAAIMGAVRSARLLSVMTTSEAKNLGVEEEERRFHIWVNPTGKPSLIPPVAVRQWLRLESVGLSNGTEEYPEGDSVGVLTAWEPPKLHSLEWLDTQLLDPCWRAIRNAPPEQRRKDPQANNWIGHLIARSLGLDLNEAEGKARTKAVIKAWEGSGLLMEEMSMTANRKEVKALKINPPAACLEG